MAGVTVTAGTNTVTTSSNGSYSFSALRSGTFTVTPSLACYHFTPASVPITLGGATNGLNFTGTRDAYTISGRLTSGPNALSGVTVSIGSKSTVTGANGNYALSNLCAGSYTIVPALSGYEFAPRTLSVTVGPDTNGVNFAASALFSIAGQIRQGTNALSGVTVAIGTNSVTSTNGAYALNNLLAGVYTVTPTLGCYRFSPTNFTITVGPSTNSLNFSATQTLFTISGRVSDGLRGLSGVAVQVSGSNGLNTTIGTDVNGNYALSGVCPGTYQLESSLPGYDFGPARLVTLANADVTGVNFSPFFAISGKVARTNGIGLSDVTVVISANGNVRTNGTTDADGIFVIPGFAPASYIVTPTLAGYVFNPANRTVTVTNQNVANINFDAFGRPSIVTQPTDQIVPTCASATFSVVAANDPPFSYQWQHNGSNIVGATNSTYVVPNGAAANLGAYTVLVMNAFGSIVSSAANLTMYLPPFICVAPNSQSVPLGSNATFTVTTSGAFPLSYQWQFDGTNIDGATDSSYTVLAASATNSGSYRVLVSNSYGSTNSISATLAVNLAPSSLTGPFSQTVGVGCSASFSVVADGSLPLSYQWRRNGTNIDGATDSVYSIDVVQPSDAGSFDVIITNSFGATNSAPALLTVDPSGSTISGQVRDGAIGLAGVTVAAGTNSAITDANGDYVIRGVQAGTYPVTATKAGYRFNGPLQATVPPCVSAANFSAQYTLSGHVFIGTNGVSGVRVLGGLTTDAQGAYSFSLPADTYTLTPFKAGYIFKPSSRTIAIPPDAADQDFYATWLINNITHLANGSVQFAVAGSGRVRVEESSNLISWVGIYTNLAPFIFTDSTARSAPVRFYRVVLQ